MSEVAGVEALSDGGEYGLSDGVLISRTMTVAGKRRACVVGGSAEASKERVE